MYTNQEIQSFSTVLLTSYNYMEESLKGESMMCG